MICNRNKCQVLYLDLKIVAMLKRTGHRVVAHMKKNLGVQIDASWQFIVVPQIRGSAAWAGGVFGMSEVMHSLCCGAVPSGASLLIPAVLGFRLCKKNRQRVVTGCVCVWRGVEVGVAGSAPKLVTHNKGTGEAWPGHNSRRSWKLSLISET